ncbi:VanZ family protein [Georgenia faecalis]|uniref:VanZ family protein n=1 Tax=Georgenia faecalis TaxID=2483799 RepID=A0ABV9DB18_9MICO|nr:VanZ family protein [Georgenia faecalis]
MSPSARRALLALAVVVNLAALYAPSLPSTGATSVPGSDKVGHVLVFALLTAAGLFAGVPARWWVPLLVAHAVGSEVVQDLFLPRRSGDPRDALADLAGVAVGWWLGARLRTRWPAEPGPSGPVR